MEQSTSQNRRRDKPILSCAFCRGRKLRCDRQSPCSACARRGKPAECIYSSSEQERKDSVDYRPHKRNQQARQRVARLEKLVTKLMKEKEQGSRQPSDDLASKIEALSDTDSTLTHSDGHAVDNMGKLSLTDSHAVYVGSSHWDTILEDIRGLKDELSDKHSDSAMSRESTPFDGGSMHGLPATRISLLSSAASLPREQILPMIPPRKVVDRHVSHFFNAFDMASYILDRKKFLAEYANFWINPSAPPIIWIGLLFSIMSMSAYLQQQDAEPLSVSAVESQEMLETYRTLTIYCLIAGDYLRPGGYTIETLILHFGVDQNVNIDTDVGNWVLIGVIIRIAMRMGLHRDPSHWPNIQPLRAELRRRAWLTLYQMDFFTSTQVGLPRIIKDSQCDARLPIHLFDNDIGFEHDEIPPERPSTDPTPLLYMIERHAIIKISAEIYDATEAASPSSATIAALDAKLGKAIDSIPEWLKYRPLETSIADNPATIMNRMFLDILTHKAVYLLHRRSFAKGSVGQESKKSNKLCIEAALAILEHQRRIIEETQPGGLMFGIRWKIVSSLNHEFLQATTMLCFALNNLNEGNVGSKNSFALRRRDQILEALINAKSVWEKNAIRSVEARRAVNAITTVLKQDLDMSRAPTLTVSNEPFEQVPGVAAPTHFGNFDYGQNMTFDPSFFAAGDNVAAFVGILDDFVIESVEENQVGDAEAVLVSSTSFISEPHNLNPSFDRGESQWQL